MRPPLRPGAPGLAGVNGAGKPKKGICTNQNYINPDTGETEKCPNCESGRVLTVNVNGGMGFNCPICHSQLTAVKGGGRKGLIIGAIAAVLAIAGGTAFGLQHCDRQNGTDPDLTDSLRIDSINRDSIKIEQLRIDSLKRDSIRLDSIRRDSIRLDSIRRDSIRRDSLRRDSLSKFPPPPYPKTVLKDAARMPDPYTIIFREQYLLDLGTNEPALRVRSTDRIINADIHKGVLTAGDLVDNQGNLIKRLSGLRIKL